MAILFWTLIGIVAYTYVGYPAVLFLWSRVRPRPLRAADVEPRVSFVIPAHNEALVIERKIRNTLALDYPADRLQIIVASDGSTDETNAIAERFEDEGVRLAAKVPRRGKNALLNDVVPTLGGEVVVVSDANIELEAGALRQLMRAFGDRDVGGAWGNKVYRNASQTAAGEGESLYLRYEKRLKTFETRAGSIVSGECSCLAFRRALFRTLPLDVPDDFAISTNVVAGGRRLVYVPEAISYEETAPTDGGEFNRKVRIIERGIRGFCRVWRLANPWRTGFYAVSLVTRQLLRRAVAVLYLVLAAMLPVMAVRGGVYLLLLALAGLVVGLAGVGLVARGGWRRTPVVFVPYFLVVVNVAALVGMARCVMGIRSVSWQPTSRAVSRG